ncbi:MAG: hypothetical protein ACO22I_05505 [Candidatus Nanopelagicales bacterium]
MKTKYAFLSVASLILVACGSTSEVTSNENQSESSQAVAQAAQDPANAGYYIDGILYTLVNGELEQPIEESTAVNKFKLLDFKASGDLNKDGTDDVAVIITNDTGESGTFYYLSIFTSGTPVVENTYNFGDRVVVKDLKFADGKFQVTYLDRSPEEDIASEPSIEITTIAEMDEENSSFVFSCVDNAGICF